ncbi:MAG TPA: c-type cytochrome [Candidatus Angelobacter sp.]
MRTSLLAAIIIGYSLCALYGTLPAQQDKPEQTAPPAPSAPPGSAGPRSVWDGVYTEEQAKRGDPLYHSKCASCHGDKMTGGESAPPLAGGQFLSNWNGLTLDVLFERIRVTMPSDNPSRVGRPPKADILAYILSMNRFPPGETDLQYKTELLKGITFEANKP